MFTINPENGFCLYVGVLLGGLVALAVADLWRRRTQDWQTSEEQLCRCPDCRYAFVMPRRETSAACPRCHRTCAVRTRRGGLFTA